MNWAWLTEQAERYHALGLDVEAVERRVALARRRGMEALPVCVALDLVAPVPGRAWYPMCGLCVDALEVHAGLEVPAWWIARDRSHDAGPCSMGCGSPGHDTMVACLPGTPREMLALLGQDARPAV